MLLLEHSPHGRRLRLRDMVAVGVAAKAGDLRVNCSAARSGVLVLL
jgi:hypothetical protein